MALSDYKPIHEDKFTDVAASADPMTLNGTIQKATLLLAIVVGSAVVGWLINSPLLTICAMVVAFVLALVGVFKPQTTPIVAPLYGVFEGLFLGGISLIIDAALKEKGMNGAIPMAILGTFAVFGVMFMLYATRIIRVTETFRSVVIGATLAVGLVYLGSFLISFVYPAIWQLPMYQSGVVGIGFSVFVIGLAAFNLALDFDVIETGVEHRAPRFMEWYAAFGLMITLVWIYIEILRLMMKLRR